MGLRIFGMPPNQVLRLLVRLRRFTSFHPVGNQLRRGKGQVWVKRQGAFVGIARASKHLLATSRIGSVVVITKPQVFPCRSVTCVHSHRALQHGNSFFVRGRIVRHGRAAQVQVISFLVPGTRSAFRSCPSHSQRWQQCLSDPARNLVPHGDHVAGGDC